MGSWMVLFWYFLKEYFLKQLLVDKMTLGKTLSRIDSTALIVKYTLWNFPNQALLTENASILDNK